jgi:hypothetical protein
MDDETLNGTEPRRITITFADDGTPDFEFGDPVKAGDVLAAARWLARRIFADGDPTAPRQIVVHIDAWGTPAVEIGTATDADVARAAGWLALFADVDIRQNILAQVQARQPTLHLPNRAMRRALGRA